MLKPKSLKDRCLNARTLTFVTFLGLLAVCLVVGSIGGTILVNAIEASHYRLQLANNAQYGERFAATLQGHLKRGEAERDILSYVQESFSTAPGDQSRYICILSASGQVLCHPRPQSVGQNAGALPLATSPHSTPQALHEWVGSGENEGFVLGPDGKPRELVRRIPVEGTEWNVLVHTDLKELDRETQTLLRSIMTILLPMGVVFVLGGTLVARFLGRRYEKMIEQSNTELEKRVAERTQELSQAVDELRATRDELVLKEKMALVGQLVAGIAHEINNPLYAISLHAEVLKEIATDEDERRSVESIEKSAQRCSLLVKNLLSFARNDPPRLGMITLQDIVDAAVQLTQGELERSRIVLEQRMDPQNPTLLIDRIQIEQVLVNLLNNAAQVLATQEGVRRILLEARVTDACVLLAVEDNGPGIPEEIRQHLFEPFHTTKKQGKGTGLGLSLCRQFVERHGGMITLEQGELGGARFLINLPRQVATNSSTPPARVLSAVS